MNTNCIFTDFDSHPGKPTSGLLIFKREKTENVKAKRHAIKKKHGKNITDAVFGINEKNILFHLRTKAQFDVKLSKGCQDKT